MPDAARESLIESLGETEEHGFHDEETVGLPHWGSRRAELVVDQPRYAPIELGEQRLEELAQFHVRARYASEKIVLVLLVGEGVRHSSSRDDGDFPAGGESGDGGDRVSAHGSEEDVCLAIQVHIDGFEGSVCVRALGITHVHFDPMTGQERASPAEGAARHHALHGVVYGWHHLRYRPQKLDYCCKAESLPSGSAR